VAQKVIQPQVAHVLVGCLTTHVRLMITQSRYPRSAKAA